MKITIDNRGNVIEFDSDYVLLGSTDSENPEEQARITEIGYARNGDRLRIASAISSHVISSMAKDIAGLLAGAPSPEEFEAFKRDLDDPVALQELISKYQKERGGGGLDA